MGSPDPPAEHHPKSVEWGPDFSSARKPSHDAPFSPGLHSPRTPLPDSRPDDARHDPAVKEQSHGAQGVAGRVMLPSLPPSPLSPVCGCRRRQQESLVIDVPRTTLPYSLPPIRPPLSPPETGRTPAASPHTGSGARALEQSEPAKQDKSLGRRESAPITGEPQRRENIHPEILLLREHLRPLGHLYLDNPADADVLVQAVPFRRSSSGDSPSASSPGVKEEPMDEDGMDHDARPPQAPGSTTFGNDITLTVLVHPRQPDRSSFVLRRKFNLDELRSTIPDLAPPPDSSSTSRRFSIADLPPRYTNPTTPRPPITQLIGHARRRATERGPTPWISPRARRAPGGSGAEVKMGPRVPAHVLPIHLEFARSYLPGLASVLLSGHVHEGDILELSLPHPQAWPQTVEYVYTGRGDLSLAVRENILYLGGKVRD